MPETTLRRSVVAVIALVCLLGTAGIVRVAGAWTAGNAPLVAKPASAEALAAELVSEQQRSADLRRQLDDLVTRSSQLAASLKAAEDGARRQAAAAAGLATRLRNAQARLAQVEAELAAAAAVHASPATASTLVATPAPVGSAGYPDD